jgi:hypothetical protein
MLAGLASSSLPLLACTQQTRLPLKEEWYMSFKSARYLIVGIALGFGCSIVLAQEVVHAVAGVVTQVNNAEHTITLKTSAGSQVVLQEEAKRDPRFEFDKAFGSRDNQQRGLQEAGRSCHRLLLRNG